LRSKIDPEAALNNATKGSIVAAEGPFQIFEKNLILTPPSPASCFRKKAAGQGGGRTYP